ALAVEEEEPAAHDERQQRQSEGVRPEPSPEPRAHRHLAGQEVAAADRHRESQEELADSARCAARALHAGGEYSGMSTPAASVDNARGGTACDLRRSWRSPSPFPPSPSGPSRATTHASATWRRCRPTSATSTTSSAHWSRTTRRRKSSAAAPSRSRRTRS